MTAVYAHSGRLPVFNRASRLSNRRGTRHGNQDPKHYGGGDIGNFGGIGSDAIAWHAFTHSINLTVPPLGIVILKLDTAPSP